LRPNQLPFLLKSARTWIEQLSSRSAARSPFGELIDRVQLSRESVQLSLKLPLALEEPSAVPNPMTLPLSRLSPMQMKRRSVETRIVLRGESTPNHADLPLLKAVARSRKCSDDLVSGKVRSVSELARREGIMVARCGG
jgi:hypothetical protein